MRNDYRENAAEFYDAWADVGDVDFYRAQLPGPDAKVLELGCGTGRVLIPLAEHCRLIQGVDLSPSMLAICRQRLNAQSISAAQARVHEGDITDTDLGRTFDLVTAPFRVMQNLETDAQVNGLLQTIRRHLAPGGQAILNTFCPHRSPQALFDYWSARDGSEWVQKQTPGGLMRMTDDCRRFQADPLTVYPVLKYEHLDGDRVVGTAELPITMRVWFPDELLGLVTEAGFRVTDRWGGYAGEPWGDGPELVVGFTHA